MSAAADEIFADAANAIEDVTEQLCADVAADLRHELRIPVGRDSKGRVTVRSLPGEYPRLETGRLQVSVTHVVYRAAGSIVGVVQTDTPYDIYLVRIRPYVDYVESKWTRLAEQRYDLALR